MKKKIFEIFFNINFTHIIRIWPKNLQFLTYEIFGTFESPYCYLQKKFYVFFNAFFFLLSLLYFSLNLSLCYWKKPMQQVIKTKSYENQQAFMCFFYCMPKTHSRLLITLFSMSCLLKEYISVPYGPLKLSLITFKHFVKIFTLFRYK